MKKNPADLTSAEKARLARRREMLVTFGKLYPVVLVVSVLLTLFAIYTTTTDFMTAFTPARATMTSGTFVVNALLFAVLFFSAYCFAIDRKFAARNFVLAVSVVSLTYILCLTTARYLSVYALPMCLCALVLLELSDRRTALLSTLVLAALLLMSFIFGDFYPAEILPAVLVSVVSNFVAAMSVNLLVGRHLTRLKFLLWSFAAAAVSLPLLLMCLLAAGEVTINLLYAVLWSYGASVAAVMVSAALVAMFEGIFNIADDFRLDELTNLNQPLLKRLASEAPGTFNHSLVVGNLSEACANAIGENPHMARAAAYYHDIGKLKSPIYFSENQSTYNPHDEIIPEVSVSIITSHTVFGEYFYRKALNYTEEGDIPAGNYTYPGPKPQTKISAIVMIADTIEAAMRAYTPDTKEDFCARINKLVDEKLALGQFDECPITMSDLATIKNTIIETLPRVQHGRVSYEKKKL